MFEKLAEIISNYVEVEPSQVKPESRFMEDLMFTSFDFMSMLGELEDEFDIEIDQQEAAKIRTVQEAVIVVLSGAVLSSFAFTPNFNEFGKLICSQRFTDLTEKRRKKL